MIGELIKKQDEGVDVRMV